MDRDYTHHLMPRKARPTQRGYGGPIVVILLSLVMLLVLAVAAFAQSSESTAISGANSEVEVSTGAIAGSAINNYGQKPGADNRTYQEVATAPSLGGLALGGGHPCAYSPATAQVSLIGGGAGIGGMKVDSACMLMVMGAAGDKAAYKASQLVIAGRDPAACRAMEQVGLVTGCKEARGGGGIIGGGRDWSKPAATAETASSKGTNTGWGAKCQLTGKKLAFQPTSKAARSAELSACKARYGL
jgi:hypothetical protein